MLCAAAHPSNSTCFLRTIPEDSRECFNGVNAHKKDVLAHALSGDFAFVTVVTAGASNRFESGYIKKSYLTPQPTQAELDKVFERLASNEAQDLVVRGVKQPNSATAATATATAPQQQPANMNAAQQSAVSNAAAFYQQALLEEQKKVAAEQALSAQTRAQAGLQIQQLQAQNQQLQAIIARQGQMLAQLQQQQPGAFQF